VEDSLREIVNILETTPSAFADTPSNSKGNFGNWFSIFLGLFPFILFFAILLLEWLASVLGRTREWYLGGFIGTSTGLLAFIFFAVYWSIFFTILLGLLGLIFDFIVSQNYLWHKENPKKRGSPNWWSGGTWGPGSQPWTSGGSDYTFSGGGGGFGGGGASGDW
jgi:uncharacterized protein